MGLTAGVDKETRQHVWCDVHIDSTVTSLCHRRAYMTFVCAVGNSLFILHGSVHRPNIIIIIQACLQHVPLFVLLRVSFLLQTLLLWYGLLLFLCQSDGVRLSDYNRICPRFQAVNVSICLPMSTLSSILPVNNMYSSSCFQQTCSKLTFACF